MDKINESTVSQDLINGIAEHSFNKLNDEQKNIVLASASLEKQKKQDSGIIGKLIGANTHNASINIALIICCILLVFCEIDLFHSFFPKQEITSEMWNLIFPVVTLALGYIFGKGKNDG